MKFPGFYRYLIPHWKKEALSLSLGLIGAGLGLVNPYLTKLIIDKAYAGRDLKLFIALIAAAALIFVLSGAVTGLGNYLNRYIRARLSFDLSRAFFKKMQSLPYGFFQDTSTGAHLYKINYDVEQSARFIADTPPQVFSLLLRILLTLVAVFYLNWKIGLSVLVLTPFLYLGPVYFTKRLKKAYAVWIQSMQGIFKKLQETFSHMQLVKAFGKEKNEARGYIRQLAGNIRLSLKNARLEAGSSFINGLAGRAILGLVIFYGGYQVIKGGMTLGDLSAISIYLAQLTGLQGAAMQFFQQASLGSISCQRLEEIFACRPQASEEKSAIFFRIPRGRIEFKDATFGYPAGKKIFENFNLVIPSGACFGLSGPSGSGKTTLINLLLRLYKLDKGEIFIDGCDIRGIKADAFYGQIGVALQEPFLWNDTLGNNIRYGNKDAPWQEVEEAAKIACANDFIATLPQGYDTVIGENACKISEGQKQRIAIARALLKRPKILILDEALSCVDTESEGAIIGNIKNALSQSTIIIISHRPSVIEKTDTIYSLNSSLLTLTAPA